MSLLCPLLSRTILVCQDAHISRSRSRPPEARELIGIDLMELVMTLEPGTERTTDVIVLGGGGSGLAAAVSSAQRGVSVLVVEKQPRLGGSTLAVGRIHHGGRDSAAATRWNPRLGR